MTPDPADLLRALAPERRAEAMAAFCPVCGRDKSARIILCPECRDAGDALGRPRADEYYVLDLKTTVDWLLWWRPNNAGYTFDLDQAGRYVGELVRARASYYDNGTTTVAIPCAEIDAIASRAVMREASSYLAVVAPRLSRATAGAPR